MNLHLRQAYRKLKLLFRILTGKEIFYKPQISKPISWYGDTGAGFFVCDQKLNNSSIVYSFGVGENISFDIELIKKYELTVYAFDPTPKSIEYIKNRPTPANFIFSPFGISNSNGEVTFYLPENSKNVSGTFYNRWNYDERVLEPIKVPVRKFSTIVKQLNHKSIDILKMDIEGFEYDVIDDILNSGVTIDQILVELHHRFPGISIEKTKEFVEKMNYHGYKISGISDSREEYSFLQVDNLIH